MGQGIRLRVIVGGDPSQLIEIHTHGLRTSVSSTLTTSRRRYRGPVRLGRASARRPCRPVADRGDNSNQAGIRHLPGNKAHFPPQLATTGLEQDASVNGCEPFLRNTMRLSAAGRAGDETANLSAHNPATGGLGRISRKPETGNRLKFLDTPGVHRRLSGTLTHD